MYIRSLIYNLNWKDETRDDYFWVTGMEWLVERLKTFQVFTNIYENLEGLKRNLYGTNLNALPR